MTIFNLDVVHPSWKKCIEEGLELIDPDYLASLKNSSHWLPGPDKIFSAFSMPISEVKYVLFGESPYPRKESANGFAFWDASVNELWSPNGLSKKVNRATSLRNIIKMLLIAEERLPQNETSQPKIAKVNKSDLINTNQELFLNFLQHGFLLLNATPVLQEDSPQKDARAWHPFTRHVLHFLIEHNPHIELILLGNIAKSIDQLLVETHKHKNVQKLYAEHPYNISFITNPTIINFFKPFHLMLSK